MTVFFDPCISRIDKILVKFCPKFLDLYASIYGKFKWNINSLGEIEREGERTQMFTEFQSADSNTLEKIEKKNNKMQ
jgi:hypothetical protein